MSYASKDDYIANVVDIKTLNVNDGKIDAIELQICLENVGDSVMWIDEVYTMAALDYDCTIRSLQTKTLTTNSTLTISGAQSGKYYALIKKGAYTLTLPTGEFSASGSVVPAGTYIITFLYDGTDYYFNYAEYVAT
jgi:hypothetical protein